MSFRTRSGLMAAVLAAAMGLFVPLLIGAGAHSQGRVSNPTGSGPAGKGKSRMVKNFTILRKKPDMTVERFYDQWEHTLAPLFAKIPGLTKYTLYFVHTQSSPLFAVTDDPVDGLAETWFESPEALKAAMQTPEFKAAIAEETKLFGSNDHYTHMVTIDRAVPVVNKAASKGDSQ